MFSRFLFLVIFAASAFAQPPRAPRQQQTKAQPRTSPNIPAAPNHYALYLEDTPVSARFATREEMQSPEASAYRHQIEPRQPALMTELAPRNILVTGSVTTLLNAVFVAAPPARMAEMRTI